MTLHFELEAFGDKQFSREILGLRDRGMDMRPAFHAIEESFLGVERYQFSSQGGNSGGWQPLAPSTVAYKARKGLDPRTLHATLTLRRALTVLGAPGQVRRMERDEWYLGADNVRSRRGYPYGRAHQHGRGVPMRKPVELTEAVRRRWIKTLQRHLIYGDH